MDARLLFVPAKDHPAGALREIYFTPEEFPRFVGAARGPDFAPNNITGPAFTPIGAIPEVSHICAPNLPMKTNISENGKENNCDRD